MEGTFNTGVKMISSLREETNVVSLEERRARHALIEFFKTGFLDSVPYWRTHPKGRPFTPEDATSTPFHGGRMQVGYSCFDDPWHLWLYLDAMRWYETAKGQDIIGFTGTRVGTGNDGEDLVVPDMVTVRRMPFSAFEAELTSTPLPPTPTFGPGWDGYSSWHALARTWAREFEVGDNPLVDIILKQGSTKKTAMPSWRGLVNGPVWDEYPGVILVDKAGRSNTYEVYVNGEQVARAWRLDEAKAMIEKRIGPCEFRRLPQEPIKTDHYYWGVQDWFGDPKIAYAAIPV
jgi:hypothetical protein